jgi:hypothetical protein
MLLMRRERRDRSVAIVVHGYVVLGQEIVNGMFLWKHLGIRGWIQPREVE